MNLEIVDRNGDGWLYAKLQRPRGQGRCFYQSLGTKNREEAKIIARDSKLEQIQHAAAADAITRDVWTTLLAGRKVKVRETVKAYEEHLTITGSPATSVYHTITAIDRFIRQSGENFANEQIAVVTAKHVADYVNQPGPLKLGTRTTMFQRISAWLQYCFDKRWVVANPCVDVVVRVDTLSQEQLLTESHQPFAAGEVKRLLAVIPQTDFWHGAVLLANAYGLRLGGVATLEYGNVVARRLRVFTRKGRKVVDEPLTDDIAAWLEIWKTQRPADESERLFPAQEMEYQIDSSRLSKQFTQWTAKAGIEGRSFHGLRVTAARREWDEQLSALGDKGKQALAAMISRHGLGRVQELLGHAQGSSVTSKAYLHSTPAGKV